MPFWMRAWLCASASMRVELLAAMTAGLPSVDRLEVLGKRLICAPWSRRTIDLGRWHRWRGRFILRRLEALRSASALLTTSGPLHPPVFAPRRRCPP